MKTKPLIIIIISLIVISSYAYYYYYVQTLMFSEIIGKTDNNLENIAIKFFDFNTGLTRHDISHLENTKDYWIKRMREVESIQNPTLKAEETKKLMNDMMQDPSLKKINKLLLNKGLGFGIKLFNDLN